MRRFRRDRLQQLLEFALGIFQNRQNRKLTKSILELIHDKPGRSIEAAIQKNGSQQRLESIGQRREPFSAPMLFLPPAHYQMITQSKLSCLLSQSPPVDEFGSPFR